MIKSALSTIFQNSGITSSLAQFKEGEKWRFFLKACKSIIRMIRIMPYILKGTQMKSVTVFVFQSIIFKETIL